MKVLTQEIVGTLCGSGYPDKLTHQDVTQGLYPVITKETEMSVQSNCKQAEDNNMETAVRRLTPGECEVLQGFPREWTNLGEWVDNKGKLHKDTSDSARYKALGNSVCLPFWAWLTKRISAQYERPATLGSLFDGISGFPLVWARVNGVGSCLWTSEIEDFPRAVAKRHFGDEETGEVGDIRNYL